MESNPLFSWLHHKASHSLSCSSSFSTLYFQFNFVQLNTDEKCTPQIFSLVSCKLHEYFNMSWEKYFTISHNCHCAIKQNMLSLLLLRLHRHFSYGHRVLPFLITKYYLISITAVCRSIQLFLYSIQLIFKITKASPNVSHQQIKSSPTLFYCQNYSYKY